MRLHVEGLEPRAMLAAVSAYVDAGDLFVVGSNLADTFEVVRDDVGGRWRINAGSNTSINGGPLGGSATIDGVLDDVRIYSRGGNDTIRVVGRPLVDTNDVPGDFILRDTGGNTSIDIVNLQVTDNAFVSTRDGNDNILLQDFDVAGALTVTTTNGADTVTVQAAQNGGISQIGENATIHAGAGLFDDVIDIRAMQVGAEVFLRSTRGDNQFRIDQLLAGRVAIFGGAEDDLFQIGTRTNGGVSTNGLMRLYGFTGADTLFMEDSTIRGNLRLFGDGDGTSGSGEIPGARRDEFRLTNIVVDDNVNGTAENLVLWGEGGNDFAQLINTRGSGTLSLNGGSGTDDLDIGTGVVWSFSDVTNWES